MDNETLVVITMVAVVVALGLLGEVFWLIARNQRLHERNAAQGQTIAGLQARLDRAASRLEELEGPRSPTVHQLRAPAWTPERERRTEYPAHPTQEMMRQAQHVPIHTGGPRMAYPHGVTDRSEALDFDELIRKVDEADRNG